MVMFCTICLKQKGQDELEATYFDPLSVAPAIKGICFVEFISQKYLWEQCGEKFTVLNV
jgi:hypothetical protein